MTISGRCCCVHFAKDTNSIFIFIRIYQLKP